MTIDELDVESRCIRWKQLNYIADFHAIDKLQSDNIIDEKEMFKLKNKLFVEIIVELESEVSKWQEH